MSAVNRQFRLAVRLAETFASVSRSLSGWAREAREVQRRTGRASAADRRESRHCLTMINGRCAQIAAIGQGQADIPFGPCGQGLRHECAVADMVSKASDPAARIRHEGRCWPKAHPRWPGCGLLASSSTGRANVLVDPEQVSEAIA
jgi:hypothetical protein